MGIAAALLVGLRSGPVALAATDGALVDDSTVLVTLAVVEPAQVGVVGGEHRRLVVQFEHDRSVVLVEVVVWLFQHVCGNSEPVSAE